MRASGEGSYLNNLENKASGSLVLFNYSHGLGLWKHISSLWCDFVENTKIKFRNGRHTRFWQDAWIGHAPLMTPYQVLRYRQVPSNAGSLVSDSWNGNN